MNEIVYCPCNFCSEGKTDGPMQKGTISEQKTPWGELMELEVRSGKFLTETARLICKENPVIAYLLGVCSAEKSPEAQKEFLLGASIIYKLLASQASINDK